MVPFSLTGCRSEETATSFTMSSCGFPDISGEPFLFQGVPMPSGYVGVACQCKRAAKEYSCQIGKISDLAPCGRFEAAAGSLSIITQSISETECERFPVISRFPKYDFTIIVKGDSMQPEFHSGDELACRFVDSPSFIQWGRPHVLDTHQGVILKRIYNKPDAILCRSENKEYEEFEIPKNEILHIALVVGSIRLY